MNATVRLAVAALPLTVCACASQHAAAPLGVSQHAAAPAAAAISGQLPPASRAGATAALAEPFAVLRRPARPGDRLPARAAGAVRRANAIHATGSIALRASSARRVALRGVPDMWVLGGRGAICLMSTEPSTYTGGAAYALTCLPTAQAIAGRLLTTYTPVPGHPELTLVEGVVPDRAGGLRLNPNGEHGPPLQIGENAYAGYARAPLSVSFQVGAATHTAALPSAPGSAAATLAAGP